MIRKFLTLLMLITFIAFLSSAIQAGSPYSETLGSNTGFQGETSFAISSATATILPTLPSGCHEAWLYSDYKFNYGGSGVSTNTYEMNWASGTNVEPLVLDKFVTPTPSTYFRSRGSDASGTVYVRFR